MEPFTLPWLPAAMALWESCPGLGLSAADEPRSMERFLSRNPGLSFVASSGGHLVGTALAGHDGRRGFLYHVAVAGEWQGRGVGFALQQACLDALAKEGILKVHLLLKSDNERGRSFWLGCGWEERSTLCVFSTSLQGAYPDASAP